MNIDGVKNGIVLDHLKSGSAMHIYEYLGLNKLSCSVAVIQNVKSSKYTKKDIIKIDEDLPLDLDVLGYFDSNITVNRIVDEKLISKVHVSLPKELNDVLICKNPRCITSIEQEIKHKFKLSDEKNKKYRCVYCDTEYSE